ncbi:MAG: methylmalonyl-CoA epimerase, partial [Gemmatimonadetes bacterium]|nr:methylmalonyl-CoA epimerase [Gemmatimonadota bacterium]
MFKIDHIGIAVNSLQTAVPLFEAMLGENPAGRETVPSEEVEVVFFGHGTGRIELLEPIGSDSPISRFLERRGQGLHHVCLQVPDLDTTLHRLAESGINPVAPGIRTGAGGLPVAFLHPRDCGG